MMFRRTIEPWPFLARRACAKAAVAELLVPDPASQKDEAVPGAMRSASPSKIPEAPHPALPPKDRRPEHERPEDQGDHRTHETGTQVLAARVLFVPVEEK